MPVSRNKVLSLAALCLGLFFSQARAQTASGLPAPSGDTAAGQGRPETYGTQSESLYSLNAWEFQPVDSAVTTSFTGSAQRYATGGSGELEAGIHLPAGALITKLEIAGCDTSPTGALDAALYACSDPDGVCSQVAQAVSSSLGAPGCAFFSGSASHTVDNLNNTYLIVMTLGTDSTLTLRNVRVSYKLQVSPAPVTPTFLDVPTTSGQFRFVEALVAAGITAGCGGGNYCPNAPVTRGQMAVFLSVALGLHNPF